MGNSPSAAPAAAPAAAVPPAPLTPPSPAQRAGDDAAATLQRAGGGSKDDARDQRLSSMKNSLREKLWQEWQKHCMQACDNDVRRYWVCRQEAGLAAPFRCTPENDAMNECLSTCGRDAVAFNEYRTRRVDEIEAAAVARRVGGGGGGAGGGA